MVVADDALPGEARVIAAAERVLSGERRGVRAVLPFLGPAFIAAVAYIDPGNFATNMAGGSQFGYTLLWVVLAANLMAMLVQSMSAKLGIATGRSLPEVCRDRLPFRVVVLLWLQAEAVAMATDLAEFVGAALGLHLVFGLSLWVSAVLTGAGGLHHPGHAGLGLPPARGDAHRAGGGGRAGLRPGGAAEQPVGCRGGPRPVRAAVLRRRLGPAGRRHHRRHRDAARDLPALLR